MRQKMNSELTSSKNFLIEYTREQFLNQQFIIFVLAFHPFGVGKMSTSIH